MHGLGHYGTTIALFVGPFALLGWEELVVNDRQLRSFVLAAEKGSFSKAAAASYISTPAFVQQINLLEKGVGFRLFDRSQRGVTLTQAGEHFLVAARQILETYDQAVARGRELEQMSGEALRIAHASDTLPHPVQLAYQEFVATHLNVRVSFEQRPLADHFDAIRSGAADLTFIGEPSEDVLGGDLRFVPLANETCSFCMRSGHPLSLKRAITKADLAGRRVVVGSYPYLKVGFEEVLPKGTELLELDRAYDMAVRARIVGSDEMLVILSRWASQYEASLKVVPSRIHVGRVGAVVRSEKNPVVEAFIDCLRASV